MGHFGRFTVIAHGQAPNGAIWIVVIYVVASCLVLSLWSRTTERSRRLTVPLALNLALSLVFASLCWFFPGILDSINFLGQARQELSASIVLLALFATSVEIPGYLFNSKYDRTIVEALESLERAILEAQAGAPEGIDRAASLFEMKRASLNAAGVGVFASAVIDQFKRMNNVDISLARTLARQLREVRSTIEDRSKHPMPELVEILGLTCVAFILGEMLAAIRVGAIPK